MPYDLQWDDTCGVYVRFWGVVSKEELQRPSLEIEKDPRAHQLRYCIADFDGVTSHDVTNYDTLLLAAHDYRISYHYLAVVTANKDIKDKVIRYANSPLMDNRKISVVGSPLEARTWIAACLAAEMNKSGQ